MKFFSSKAFEHLLFELHGSVYASLERRFEEIEAQRPKCRFFPWPLCDQSKRDKGSRKQSSKACERASLALSHTCHAPCISLDSRAIDALGTDTPIVVCTHWASTWALPCPMRGMLRHHLGPRAVM